MGRRANKRSARSNKRAKPVRVQSRRQRQAIGMRLLRTAVQPDPPVRPLMHEYSGVIRISLKSSSKKEFTSYGSLGNPATGTYKKDEPFTVNLNQTAQLIKAFMGYADATNFEVNVRKISAWGPPGGDGSPRLAVDLSDISGGLVITDRSGANHRPRMGITSPFNLWQKPNSTDYCSFFPDDESGILDLSLSWRRFSM